MSVFENYTLIRRKFFVGQAGLGFRKRIQDPKIWVLFPTVCFAYGWEVTFRHVECGRFSGIFSLTCTKKLCVRGCGVYQKALIWTYVIVPMKICVTYRVRAHGRFVHCDDSYQGRNSCMMLPWFRSGNRNVDITWWILWRKHNLLLTHKQWKHWKSATTRVSQWTVARADSNSCTDVNGMCYSWA